MPKVYVFLQGIYQTKEMWAAVSDSGFCLAASVVPLGMGETARLELGPDSANEAKYKAHYPDGYELEIIENINAPENWQVLNHIRAVTTQRVGMFTGSKN